MTIQGDTPGIAALTICESLLVALRDNATLSGSEFQEILEDAATAHREAASATDHPDKHNAVAALIEGIKKSGNSVRLVT